MKILFCGDTHGDFNNIAKLIDFAVINNCSSIMIVGDFGYFPNFGDNFLERVSFYSNLKNIDTHFIKGNHENHDELSKYKEITEIANNVFYHPNLTTWIVDNVSFFSIGGAYSIDKAYRTPGYNWFAGEEIGIKEIYECPKIKVDVVLSHDCPISVDINDMLRYNMDKSTKENREKLQAIVDIVNPKLVIHGHYHMSFIRNGSSFKNISLGCNFNSIEEQTFIYDTKTGI